jgi:DNA-binding GntR family transcriptional regulator
MNPPKDLKNQALDHIHNLLMSGKLKWGDRVSEESIGKMIGVSRTPVREALHTYTQLGIFQRLHRYGTIVRTPDVREVEELFEIRVALESYAVEEAIRYISVDEIERLGETCRQLQTLIDDLRKSGERHLSDEQVKKLFEADHAFHMGIMRAPGNRMLVKQVSETRMLLRLLGNFDLPRFGEANLVAIHADHTAILNAIETKNIAEAIHQLREHIRESKRGTVTLLKKHIDSLEDAKLNESLHH